MPIYEFECTACGHRFDHLQRLSDSDPTICPACAAAKLHRRVSAPSFRLAGSGWYETDFKAASEKKHNLADAPAAPTQAPAADTATATPVASSPAPAAAADKATTTH